MNFVIITSKYEYKYEHNIKMYEVYETTYEEYEIWKVKKGNVGRIGGKVPFKYTSFKLDEAEKTIYIINGRKLNWKDAEFWKELDNFLKEKKKPFFVFIHFGEGDSGRLKIKYIKSLLDDKSQIKLISHYSLGVNYPKEIKNIFDDFFYGNYDIEQKYYKLYDILNKETSMLLTDEENKTK